MEYCFLKKKDFKKAEKLSHKQSRDYDQRILDSMHHSLGNYYTSYRKYIIKEGMDVDLYYEMMHTMEMLLLYLEYGCGDQVFIDEEGYEKSVATYERMENSGVAPDIYGI